MRNLKKVIALVAVFAMLVSTVAFAGSYTDVADNDNYAEAIEMLSSLEILTGDNDANGNKVFRPNDPITRAEVATIVERIQNINNVAPTATQFADVPADHWASGFIAQAAGQGIINGYGDGNFGPEDNVLYEQAVKMLVETLGYAPFVEANGGYYAGHLLAASRYGVLDGVKDAAPGKQATRGQVAQLVYNAIDTPIMERSAFGTEEKFEIFDGGKDGKGEFLTLLTRDLGVVKGTGIVTENAVTGTIDTSEDEEIDFLIDDTTKEYFCYDLEDLDDGTVYAGATNAGDLLGLEVNFYAKEIKNGEYELISVAPTSRNKYMEINLSDIIDFDGKTFKFYEDDKVDDVKLATDAEEIALSYNGIPVGAYDTAADLEEAFEELFNVDTDKTYSGKITLLDNGSARGYSSIALEVAVSVVVDEVRNDVVTFKDAVRTSDGKSIKSLDFDEDETSTLIKLTKGGAAYDYSQLVEWDVISILANNTKDYYIAEVIESGKITGAVEERSISETSADGYEYRINGQYYDVAQSAYGAGSLKPSSEGTFYVDAYGKIVAFDKTSTSAGVSSDKYAYIINASVTTDEWGNNSIRVQWLDKSGEIGDTYLASTVTIENISDELADAIEGDGVTFTEEETNDIAYTDAKIKMETFAAPEDTRVEDLRDALVNQFVTYSLSADNLKSITFTMDETSEEVDLLNRVAAGEATYDEEDKEIKIGTKKYDVADETLVFFIDAEDDLVVNGAIASKYLSKVTTAAALATGSYDYIEAYDLDNDVPAVLVVYDESGLVSPNANIAVIEAVGDATVDGEAVKAITYWMNGEKATAYSDPTSDASGNADITEAVKGDIWKITVNGNTVSAARRLASYDRDIAEAGEAGAAEFDIVASSEDMVWGPVTEYKSTGGRILYAAENDFADVQSLKAANANVYVVEYVRGKLVVSTGAAIDVEYDEDLVEAATEGGIKIVDKATDEVIVDADEAALGMMDYIFAVSYDDEVQDVVIYKAGEFDKWYTEVEVIEA